MMGIEEKTALLKELLLCGNYGSADNTQRSVGADVRDGDRAASLIRSNQWEW